MDTQQLQITYLAQTNAALCISWNGGACKGALRQLVQSPWQRLCYGTELLVLVHLVGMTQAP